jgi:hypothetical protein
LTLQETAGTFIAEWYEGKMRSGHSINTNFITVGMVMIDNTASNFPLGESDTRALGRAK